MPRPQRREAPVERGDQPIQLSLLGFQFADVKSHACHRAKPNDLGACHALSEPIVTARESAQRLLTLVGEESAEVRRLRGFRRPRRAVPLHPDRHRRNLTPLLDCCHLDHRKGSAGTSGSVASDGAWLQRERLAEVPGHVAFVVLFWVSEVLVVRRPALEPFGFIALHRDVADAGAE